MIKTPIIDRAYIKIVFVDLATPDNGCSIIASAGYYEWECVLGALSEEIGGALSEEIGDEFFGSDYSLALIEERIK